jgi:hypothetical protein
MTLRLASVGLVLTAALSDAAGHHALAYYLLVTAVPVVAVAALSGLGDVLDGSAAEPPRPRGSRCSPALALPFVLLGTAVRAPLLSKAAADDRRHRGHDGARHLRDPGSRQGERRGTELPRRTTPG